MVAAELAHELLRDPRGIARHAERVDHAAVDVGAHATGAADVQRIVPPLRVAREALVGDVVRLLVLPALDGAVAPQPGGFEPLPWDADTHTVSLSEPVAVG